ncbi:hypothetical protein F511_33785 [Dorcoceras hygrometricum]|uniref:Uncharacterized protein n=1 Tax=Dorcoceras hygrometricum TaxID=472368 RepID=A0A2Z7D137_9LAMI|nr:hypothetical protein F511_33785 [Dorcoceras hygrometricum]
MTSVFLLEESGISKDYVSNISKQEAVFSNEDVSSELQIQRREVADEDRTVMMTSTVMSSQSAVEQNQFQQLTRSRRAGSAMMTSAVMSSQSAVSYRQFQQLTREAQEMERRRLTLHSISAVALNSRCIQLLQAFNCWGAENKTV